MIEGDASTRDLLEALFGDDPLPFVGPPARQIVGAEAARLPSYDGVFQRLLVRGREIEAQVTDETVGARRDLATLLALPPEQRAPRVRASATRFRGPVLAELLLDEGGRDLDDAPHRAHHLALLAQEVLMTCSSCTYAAELLVRALASRAHALTALGEFAAAHQLFALVHALAAVLLVDDLAMATEVEGLAEPADQDRCGCGEGDAALLRCAVLAGLFDGPPFHPHRFL